MVRVRDDRPRLALVFYDGYREDRDLVAPALETADARGCFAVNPGRLGRAGLLDADGVRALADAGHDVLAHGREHRFLGVYHPLDDLAPDGRRLRLPSHVFPGEAGGLVAGDEHELLDGDRTITREVVAVEPLADDRGTDSGGVAVLEKPVGATFAAAETAVRPVASVVRDEVVGARDALADLGVETRGFAFPYDAADRRAWLVAREAYDAVVDVAIRSLPNLPGTDLRDLRRYYLETDALTRPELVDYLDGVAAVDGLGVLAGHAAWPTVTTERLAFVLGAARERGVTTTTVDRLLTGDGGRD